MYGVKDKMSYINRKDGTKVSTIYIYKSNEKEILNSESVVITDMKRLISGYSRVGEGKMITTGVICDNEIQSKFIRKNIRGVTSIVYSTDEDKLYLNKYSRLIFGEKERLMK